MSYVLAYTAAFRAIHGQKAAPPPVPKRGSKADPIRIQHYVRDLKWQMHLENTARRSAIDAAIDRAMRKHAIIRLCRAALRAVFYIGRRVLCAIRSVAVGTGRQAA